MRNNLQKICLLFIFITALSIGVFGQSPAIPVYHFNVKFRSGQSQAVRRGKADYGTSYVYRLKVRKGQRMEVSVESAEKDLIFSVAAPKEEITEDRSGVKQWTGRLQETGTYLIVLVMNNENAKKVPYRLHIKVE